MVKRHSKSLSRIKRELYQSFREEYDCSEGQIFKSALFLSVDEHYLHCQAILSFKMYVKFCFQNSTIATYPFI